VSEVKRIDETRAAFSRALANGDAKAISILYAEDAMLLPPAAPTLKGAEEIERFWRAGIEAGISEVEREPLQVESKDGLAYEVGRYVLRLDPADGDAVIDRGSYFLVHERQPDGSWLRAVETFNPELPPARADETVTTEMGRDAGVQHTS
jgi:ketosteroid isomerase-like protein